MQTIKLEVGIRIAKLLNKLSRNIMSSLNMVDNSTIKKFDYTNPVKTKGYFYDKRRNMYRVQIVLDGKRNTIGSFKTEEEARTAYQSIKLQEIERKRSAKSI